MFRELDNNETQFIRGQLVLVAAGPGTGKSAFVLTQALKSGVTCLYFSADSDPFVQLSRSIAILNGCTLSAASRAVREDDLSQFSATLDEVPIRLNYEASPNLDSLILGIESYWELYGEFPQMIVVDNVTNVRTEGGEDDDPFSGLEGLMDYLHEVARETGACVVGLHHVVGSYNDAAKAIPLSGVKGQITRVPELVLTMHKEGTALRVSTVKNRAGKSDPSGNSYAELEFEGERMKISDPPYATGGEPLWE